jgi:hypothetical protein
LGCELEIEEVNVSITRNPITGATHTAKWPAILSFLAGVIILAVSYLSPEFTFGEAMPITLSIWAIGGIGTGAMVRRR